MKIMRDNYDFDENGDIIDLEYFIGNIKIEIDTPIEMLIADAHGKKIDCAVCTLYYKKEIAASIRLYPREFPKVQISSGFEVYESSFEEVMGFIDDFCNAKELSSEMRKYNKNLESNQKAAN